MQEISKREQSINQTKFIKFDEGLFTTIPAILVNRLVAKETKEHMKNVEQLFSEIITTQSGKYDGKTQLTRPTYIFYSDIFKLEISNNNLLYVGKFNVCDETMKEAIRQKKGVFLPFNYGIIIYWLHEFNDIQLLEDNEKVIVNFALQKSRNEINPVYSMYFQRK